MASDHNIDADLVAELLPFFIDDVIERLGTVEEMVVRFSKETTVKPDSFELLRHVHSIKGAAASFGFPTIALIAHHLEDYIIATGNFRESAVEGILEHVQAIGRIVESRRDPGIEEGRRVLKSLPDFHPSPALRRTAAQRTVLFIGPRNIQLRLMEPEIRATGFRLVALSNSFQGIESAIRTRPDLILISNIIDILDGVDVARMIRVCEVTQSIPLIVVASKLDAEPVGARLRRQGGGILVVRKGEDFAADFAKALVALDVV
ncbi:Hpt domain-containing protein [Skermanella rosea]|uniref:Hpt domain-containing protein n=1 Tax=Skermanella rosea TaxID=1817965 RepID=UPI001933CFD3|nr:Hpt domain-containing protein [Skermanella rosea]UEM06431.1 Hpt domain-containing protein [Skermanella rosea]